MSATCTRCGEGWETYTGDQRMHCDRCQEIVDIVERANARAEDLEEQLAETKRDADFNRRLYEDTKKKHTSVTKELESEREGLTSWLRSRIAQQQQALKMKYIGNQTKVLIEVEVGLVERYLANILEGKHRNNRPSVSVPDDTPFKPLRQMEKDDVLEHLQRCLEGVRELKKARPEDQTYEGSEHTLITLMDQITGDEHRTS